MKYLFHILFCLIFSCIFISKNVNAFFDESFNGSFHSSVWSINNSSGIIFTDNELVLEQVSPNIFPYIYTLDNIISESDNLIEVKLRYTSAGRFGNGISFTDNVPPIGTVINSTTILNYSIIYVWQNDLPPYFHIATPLCAIGQECNENLVKVVIETNYIDLNNHNLKIIKNGNVYNIYLDDEKIFESQPTTRVINKIWFGHPEITSTPDTWSGFAIDNISSSFYEENNLTLHPYIHYQSQKDTVWGGEEYDTASGWAGSEANDISRWGCALTSASMILNNFEVKNATDGAKVNPSLLNNWLLSQGDGYIGNGLVNWLAIARFAKESLTADQSPTALEFVKQPFELSYVEAALNDGKPVILSEPGHFVLGYDQSADNLKLADPNDVTRLEVAKTENDFTSAGTFTPSNTNLAYILMQKTDGLIVDVFDANEQLIPVTFITEFPDLTTQLGYWAKPPKGTYYLKLNGGSGGGRLIIYFYDLDGKFVKKEFQIIENEEKQLEVFFDPENLNILSVGERDVTPPPTPQLLSPPSGSYVNTNGLILDWSEVEDVNGPVTYWYQSFWGESGHYGPVSTGSKSEINAGGSADRRYTWQVKACDTKKNCSEWSQPWILNVDSTPPPVPLVLYPEPETYFATTPILNKWTKVNDNTGVAKYILQYEYDDHHTFSGYPYRETTSTQRNHTPALFEQGGVSFRVLAVDLAGNKGGWSEWRHYYYDETAPLTPGIPTSSPNPTNSLEQNWDWTASTDNVAVKGYYQRVYDIIGESYSSWLYLGNTLGAETNLTDGWWQMEVYAVDMAGNASQAIISNPLLVDTAPPAAPESIRFLNPNLSCGEATNMRLITVDWSEVSDPNLAGYQYQINYPKPDGTRGIWTTTFVNSYYRGSLNEGEHEIKVRAYDSAGNYSPWSPSCTVTYDPNPPTSTITTPLNTGNDSTINLDTWDGVIAGTASDELTQVKEVNLSIKRLSDGKYWDGNNWEVETELEIIVKAAGTSEWSYRVANIEEGEYTLSSKAVDLAGNQASPYLVKVVFVKPIPQTGLESEPEAEDGAVMGETTENGQSINQASSNFARDLRTPRPKRPLAEIREGRVLGESVVEDSTDQVDQVLAKPGKGWLYLGLSALMGLLGMIVHLLTRR